MKKILIIIFSFSFLFPLGKRQDRKDYIIKEYADFPLFIRGVLSWSKYDGKWASVPPQKPKFKAYTVQGFNQYLILNMYNGDYYSDQLFIFDVSKFKNYFPLKDNNDFQKISIPYIFYNGDIRKVSKKYEPNISTKKIESIVAAVIDSVHSVQGNLVIYYYSYTDNGSNMVQYSIINDYNSPYTTINRITPSLIYSKNPTNHELENSFLEQYHETDKASFIDFLSSFKSFSSQKKRRKYVAYDKAPESKKRLVPQYPDICKTAGVEGRVIIEFFVDKKGNVDDSSISILNSVPCLDQECINLIKNSEWKPAQQGKDKVGIWVTLPFLFSLK